MKKLIVSLVAVLTISGSALAIEKENPYSDLSSDHPNYNAILTLTDLDILQGYGDKTFKPDQKISRDEFLKITMEALDLEPSGEGCFPDAKDRWSEGYICHAHEMKIIKGYDDNLFHPERQINLVEASKIVANSFKLPMNHVVEPWYEMYVVALSDHQALPLSITSLEQELTRGEMSEIIHRTLLNHRHTRAYNFDNRTYKQLVEFAEIGNSPENVTLSDFASANNIVVDYMKVPEELDVDTLEKVGANIYKDKSYVYEFGWNTHGFTIIPEADLESIEAFQNIDIYIVYDKDYIYIHDLELGRLAPAIEKKGLELFAERLFIGPEHLYTYYNAQLTEVANSDVTTMEQVNHEGRHPLGETFFGRQFLVDRGQAYHYDPSYYQLQIIKDIDAPSFEVIHDILIKDKNGIYLFIKRLDSPLIEIPTASPNHFEIVDHYPRYAYYTDWLQVYYAIDKEQAYFIKIPRRPEEEMTITLDDKIDVESYESLEHNSELHSFSKDKNNVYIMTAEGWEVLDWAKPDGFEIAQIFVRLGDDGIPFTYFKSGGTFLYENMVTREIHSMPEVDFDNLTKIDQIQYSEEITEEESQEESENLSVTITPTPPRMPRYSYYEGLLLQDGKNIYTVFQDDGILNNVEGVDLQSFEAVIEGFIYKDKDTFYLVDANGLKEVDEDEVPEL